MTLLANSVVTVLVNSRGWSFLRVVFSQTRHFTVIAFTDGNMYATSMTQRNVLKATVPDRTVVLPELACVSLLCAWARHLMTRTQRSQEICTSLLPTSKTPVNQKNLSSLHIAPLPSENEQRLENEQRKSYRILIPSCWTTDIWLFDFYRKRGLGPRRGNRRDAGDASPPPDLKSCWRDTWFH